MNKGWSEMNKMMQNQIKKSETFDSGIGTLMNLRSQLMKEILSFREKLSDEEFSLSPHINVKGYHNKTVAYSLWHIFRIEDIVVNTLILGRQQVFFGINYDRRIKADIITTGNELLREEIVEFSKQLDIDELYNYIGDVSDCTNDFLINLDFSDIKAKIKKIMKKN